MSLLECGTISEFYFFLAKNLYRLSIGTPIVLTPSSLEATSLGGHARSHCDWKFLTNPTWTIQTGRIKAGRRSEIDVF